MCAYIIIYHIIGPGLLFDRGKSQDGLVLEDPEPDPPMFAQPRLTRTRSKQQGISLPPMENMMHEHDEMMKRKRDHDDQHHHQQPIQPQPQRPHVQPIYGKQASQHIQHTSHPHIPTSTSYGAYPTNPTFSSPEVILQRQQGMLLDLGVCMRICVYVCVHVQMDRDG